MGFLPLSFVSPFVLGALIALPAIWYLLRLTPPKPQEVTFPPTRLLFEIIKREETPSKSPWWLTLLRLILATLVILALAGPVWRPAADLDDAKGPLWLLVDNGWAAGDHWQARVDHLTRMVTRAGDRSRPVVLVATADGAAQRFEPAAAEDQATRLAALEPRPWSVDRAALIEGLRKSAEKAKPGSIVWLADGIDDGNAKSFAETLTSLAAGAPVTVASTGDRPPLALTEADNGLKAMTATLVRPDRDSPLDGKLRAFDAKGRVVAETPFAFATGATATTGAFDLPIELRNEIARVDVVDESHAAAVQLLDERWRRRAVGLISGVTADQQQPLLSPVHYLQNALRPFAEVREPKGDLAQSVKDLVRQNVSVIMTADVGTMVGEVEKTLADWVGQGGVLVRFAGPRLAAVRGGDKLVPVELRQGGRTLGGALSWAEPQTLGSFSQTSPFAGLAVPKDVNVTRQVLAEPKPDLGPKTWASLGDGTPLVTAARLGNGWVILFHVTADTGWSNLPLSGTFIEMLRRVVAFSAALGAKDTGEAAKSTDGAVLLPPLRLIDGFGRSVGPSAEAKPIAEHSETALRPNREHPPGLYGSEDAFVALNLMRKGDVVTSIDLSGVGGVRQLTLSREGPKDLKPFLFAAALLALILDAIAVLWLGGRLHGRRPAAAALLLALGLGAGLAVAPGPSLAAEPARSKAAEDFNRQAALGTRLAYVITGNAEIDDTSKRGLEGLTRALADRTALEPAAPVGVDLARDELAFFPLLYWPVDPSAGQPSAAVLARMDAFMKNGGTILFDTRDALSAPALRGNGRTTPATEALRRILSGLDVPELEPVPSDHVLTKSFYLLQDFPGRYEGGQLWVEATPARDPAQANERPVRPGDGVTPIMISSNDLAGAWALTDNGDFLWPTVPPDPRQREMAYRVGINVVMYTLTGNYKADQVHVPALLERLGQ